MGWSCCMGIWRRGRIGWRGSCGRGGWLGMRWWGCVCRGVWRCRWRCWECWRVVGGVGLVVGVWGVLRAGGAFLVLDPGYPAERLGVMADTADAMLVVVSSETAGLVGGRGVVDVADPGIAVESPVAFGVEVAPE